jgi:hypothetical protein
MKTNVKIGLVLATMTGATFLHFAAAKAGVNVNETGNSVSCKGQQSCTWLQQGCNREGGKYSDGTDSQGEVYGRCSFPLTGKINDFAAPSSSPTPTPGRRTSPIRQR